MPTDLGVAAERKRKATQAQTQTEITIVLVWLIISLAMLVLLVADQSFSKATIELCPAWLRDLQLDECCPTQTAKPSAAQCQRLCSSPNLALAPNPSHGIGRVVELAVKQGDELHLVSLVAGVRPKKNSVC